MHCGDLLLFLVPKIPLLMNVDYYLIGLHGKRYEFVCI